jgi:predicted O-methyltransferase YrrM
MSALKISKYIPHHREEFFKLLSLATWTKSILEIGSRYGDTLVELARASDKAKIVCVDMPNVFPWGEDSEARLKQNVEKLEYEGYDAVCFIGDSKGQEIIEAVQKLGPYDLVFIDGDHTYEGAKTDWLNYGKLGKTVVFHDIVKPKEGERQELEVWKLWQELEGNKEEFIGEGSKMGLGIYRW